MYVQDPDGRIVHANRAACELVGKPPRRSSASCRRSSSIAATVERWAEQNREILRTGRPIDVEDGWDGRTHLTHKTPVFDAEGKAVAVIGISTDITDRKRAEDALRRSERHLAEAQQIAGVGSWHWDVETGGLTGRPSSAASSAFAPEEPPTAEEALLLIHEDDRERVREATGAALAGEAPMDLDMRICAPRRRDPDPALPRARPRSGPDGSTRRLDGTCVDVTDRRRAERRLAEAQRLAQLGSWDLDVGRDEITWSREMYRIFGEDPEHFVPTSDLLTEPRRRGGPRRRSPSTSWPRASAAATSTRSPASGAPTGRSATSASAARWCPGPARASGHLHGICQDLTDVRRAEGARAEAVERFRSVFERAPIGMALLARDGRFTLANEAMAEFLGRPRRHAARLPRRRRHPSRRHAGDERGAAADGGGRAGGVERREALRAAERRGPLGRPAGAAPARRGRPQPSTAWRSCATSPTSGWPSGGAPRSTASRGSWPAARR